MQWHRRITALAVAIVALTGFASGATGEPSATKQRIAIEERFVLATGKGTFRIIPLSPGPLKKDTGTLVGGGEVSAPFIKKNGQKVNIVKGFSNYSGRNGTLRVTQRVETHNAGFGNGADTGTWSVKTGTGLYAGLRGGGGFAAAGSLKTGIVFSRSEGYVITG
jgi:hypothetical protein